MPRGVSGARVAPSDRMRPGWIAVVVVTSACSGVRDSPATLRIEPDTIALDVDLAAATPSVPLHVLMTTDGGSEVEVTADATFSLTGAPIGKVIAGAFASDGATGGHATLHAAYDQLTADAGASA